MRGSRAKQANNSSPTRQLRPITTSSSSHPSAPRTTGSSFPSSSSDGDRFGFDAGVRFAVVAAVGSVPGDGAGGVLERDRPAPIVKQPVFVPADGDTIGKVGRAAVFPPIDVMHLALGGRHLAADADA